MVRVAWPCPVEASRSMMADAPPLPCSLLAVGKVIGGFVFAANLFAFALVVS